MYCEKLHVKFLRYISGVHKKACNQAVVGELGRFPMFVDIIKCNLKYLLRIEALPEFIKNAMYENNFLYQNNKSSCSSSIHFILDKLYLQHLIHDRNIDSIASSKGLYMIWA